MSLARWTAPLVLLALAAGCLGAGPTDDVEPAAAGEAPTLALTDPIQLTDEEGFEPSIAVGPEGTVYATAAPTSRPHAGEQLSSHLWYAEDGEAWAEVPSPGQAHQAFPGFEGDVAVDGEGRLYFVDINLADTFLHRWSPGPTWELSRPLATTIPIDDRPWLAAHGDGVVYLLLNNGPAMPAPEGLLAGDTSEGDKWLFVSEDGGETWTPGRQVSDGEAWCQLDASPADDETVLLVCEPPWGTAGEATVRLSTDRGRTFEDVHRPGLDRGAGFLVPGAAVDDAGALYGAYVDERIETGGFQEFGWAGDEPGRLRVTVSPDGGDTWSDHDITPFEARYSTVDVAAGSPGTVAVTFYATEDLEPGEDTPWYPYLMVTDDATSEDLNWTLERLLDEPAGTGPTPPLDFFQNAIGPDDAVHVVLQKNKPYDVTRDGPASGIPADVLYVRQTAGPNLEG